MIRPGNELLTDRQEATSRWLPTTGLHYQGISDVVETITLETEARTDVVHT